MLDVCQYSAPAGAFTVGRHTGMRYWSNQMEMQSKIFHEFTLHKNSLAQDQCLWNERTTCLVELATMSLGVADGLEN